MKVNINKKSIWHRIGLLAGILLVGLVSVAPAENDPLKAWPKSTPEAQGIRSEDLIEMLTHIEENKLAVDSITIVRNGHMVLDIYFYPFQKNATHIMRSCTKSLTSTAFGIAKDKGYIKDLDQPVLSLFPDMQFNHMDDNKKAMRLEHLLTMTAGLSTKDSYLWGWPGLYEMHLAQDWVQYTLDRPMAGKPGDLFEYSNCVTFLLSAIVQKTTRQTTFAFLTQHLFKPLGITDVQWDTSPKGISTGYDRLWMTPHDMAKIGWLYLNRGRWGDQQIVSEKWVRAATQKHATGELFDGYGYQWWIITDKIYAAVGYEGQFIFVVPSKNLVAVFTSTLPGTDFYEPVAMLKQHIIPAATSDSPLPANPARASRIQSLIDRAARPQPYIWKTQEEGQAASGKFVRTAQPAFTLSYPPGCRMRELNPKWLYQIMAMRTLDDCRFSVFIKDSDLYLDLKDFGPEYFLPALQSNPDIHEAAIRSNKSIHLEDGTPAHRIDIQCKYKLLPLDIVVVVARKQDRFVYVTASGMRNSSFKDNVKFVESLSFH